MAAESTRKRYASAHAVFSLSCHIVFCPKYRRPVLSPLEDEPKALFQEKAMEMGLTIKAMEIMPDHVHIFLTAPPSLEPQHIVNQLKGYTSRILGQEHKWLRSRLPTLWTRSSYIGSVGTVSASTVENISKTKKGYDVVLSSPA